MSSQRDISAGGDVAGRDINKSQTTNYNYPQPKSRLAGLIDQLRDQIGKDKDAEEFVERLLSWMKPKETPLRRDLAEKLADSRQDHLISDALEAKERFTKQLRRTSFNPALQEIYAHILGEIYTTFNYKVKPKIRESMTPGIIDGEIYNLASGIMAQIADAPAELGLDLTDVTGMLYYLTGNCYLEWTYNDTVSSGH